MTGRQPAPLHIRFRVLPWPIHPWPMADETVESWLLRFCRANRVSPRKLMSLLVPGRQPIVSPTDLSSISHELSLVSAVPLSLLNDMQRREFADLDRSLHPNRLPIGRYSRFIKICPHCLLEDEKRSIRASWQQECYVACERHHNFLAAACHQCGTRFSLLLWQTGKDGQHWLNTLTCLTCSANLISTPTEYLQSSLTLYDIQNFLYKSENEEYYSISKEKRISKKALRLVLRYVDKDITSRNNLYAYRPEKVEHINTFYWLKSERYSFAAQLFDHGFYMSLSPLEDLMNEKYISGVIDYSFAALSFSYYLLFLISHSSQNIITLETIKGINEKAFQQSKSSLPVRLRSLYQRGVVQAQDLIFRE